MLKLNRLAHTIQSFAKDESGNFALMFAAASTVLMLTAGVAVDYSRMVSTKTQLRAALDSALLSTAKDLAKGKITAAQSELRANQFFEANLSGTRFPSGSAHLIDFVVDPKDLTVSANATTDLKMMFPVFGTGKTAKVFTTSAAGFTERKVEVSMVLDVTGSMAESKINDLKVAAKAGVSEFLANGAGNTRVAIVPYSFGVNAGGLSKYVVDTKGKPAKDSCSTERRGPEMFSDASPITAKITRADKINYTDPNNFGVYDVYCPASAVLPLTKNATTLNKVIDSLSPVGGTAGQIGVQWGWYMLSPQWKSVLTGAAEPEEYNQPNVDKYLILMTDGMFNSEATGLKIGDVPSHAGISQFSGNLALNYCDAIKDKNVKVFTIGFRLKDIGDKAQQTEATKMLMDCASTPTPTQQTFFNAENGSELTKAFQEIAKRVETVRLTN